MPGGMVFSRHLPNRPEQVWDFDPGDRLLRINDIRLDRETRELLLELLGLGGDIIIDAVLDVLAGSDGIIITRENDIITISVDPSTMPDFDEAARDALADALVAGPGITITPDDPENVITIEVALDDATLLENTRDTVAAFLAAGAGISLTHDDPGNTLTVSVDTSAINELARDALGTALVGGTNISVTPNDGSDTITIAFTGSIPTTEEIQDIVGALITAGSGITVNYNDAGAVETISLTNPVPTTEDIQDIVGALIAAGSGVAVTYDDSGAVETISAVGRDINDQTGTSYTLVLADKSKWVRLNNASAITLTVPPNSSVAFPVGTEIEGNQAGAGQVTITPGSGVTVNGVPGLKVAAQYGVFGLKKVGTDTWLAYGRLSA